MCDSLVQIVKLLVIVSPPLPELAMLWIVEHHPIEKLGTAVSPGEAGVRENDFMAVVLGIDQQDVAWVEQADTVTGSMKLLDDGDERAGHMIEKIEQLLVSGNLRVA